METKSRTKRNKINITKRVVDDQPLTNDSKTRIEFWDATLPGFGIRIGSKRKAYVVQKKVNGKPVKVTLGLHGHITPEQARKMAGVELGRMTQGVNSNEEERRQREVENELTAQAVPLHKAFDDLLSDRKALKKRTIQDMRVCMNKYFPTWLPVPLKDITREMVSIRHKEIGEKGGGQAQANLAMRYLRAIFNYANGKYCDSTGRPFVTDNPVKALSITRAWYRVERKQTTIKAHELPALFDAFEKLDKQLIKPPLMDTVIDYVKLLLLTGLRRNEGATLRWNAVDFRDKSITVSDTKNHNQLKLPLSDYLLELLEKRYANRTSEYVFPSPSGTIPMPDPTRQVDRVKQASGLSFAIHDIRRTFITIAESLDISAYSIKRLVNHTLAGGDITAGYVVADVERLRAPMQTITDKILQLAGRRNVANVIPIHRSKQA